MFSFYFHMFYHTLKYDMELLKKKKNNLKTIQS